MPRAGREDDKMSKIISLAKRRGFIFQSSEIYGGLTSCWDYGPAGVELKRNVKNAWWRSVIAEREDVVGLDASILMHPKVWKSSGHLDGFSDPMADCLLTGNRFRTDHIEPQSGTVLTFTGAKDAKSGKESDREYKVLATHKAQFDKARKTAREYYKVKHGIEKAELLGETMEEVTNTTAFSPENGGLLSEVRNFNLLFRTFMGPVEDSSATVYLRPETAQGIFVNFVNVQRATRKKIPFGIGQVGKSFRNEITPGNYTFRTREFEQMELEFFVKPGTDEEWYSYWRDARYQWYINHGIAEENLTLRDHAEDELAHYAKACVDMEYKFPFGWSELEGVANRTDFDLKAHSEGSGKHLTYFDEQENTHYTPYVIEPSAGADRATLAFLCDAYREEGEGKGKRKLLSFHPAIAPYKVAVLPLVKRDGMPERAQALYTEFLQNGISAQMEANSSIGKRYARQDEIGTCWCITIDTDTLEQGTVTIRDRDTKEQVTIAESEALSWIREKLIAAKAL
ncbi:glycine--tRNA ligase [Chitinivibrio alkaliphilus]|uniref:Glycine--tRNA ligase n=1 Tax=Chitinivibrio alkaliphilus ACht1 TaxID=1313304 RepID=U7D6Q4_9BACT|nr:glycine--tRNA ligase [Chitinivibrio alkaliphilus]ERP31251.1 glycyl-tRNA synthetase [Chitinivibrio alkaliphilus ACht1]